MLRHSTLLLLITVSLMAASGAEAQEESVSESPPPESSDIGTPDPLNEMERQNTEPPPPEIPALPEFTDVDSPPGAAPETTPETPSEVSPPVNAETPAPFENPPSAADSEPSARPARQAEKVTEPIERQADDPDLRREARFHRIYEKYNSQPTPLEAWEQASSSRTSEVYKVQRGDTLWDLSRTLFGDPNYWPKVWALNSDEVDNPHEIDTWMQVRFYPGNLNEPPTLAVAETVAVTVTVTEAETTTESPGEIPPPRRKIRPIVKKLPPSIPLYRHFVVNEAPLDFKGVKPFPSLQAPPVALSYYVSDSPVQGLGSIKETELGLSTASEFQYVFVDVPASGERIFTVVKDIGEVRDTARSDGPTGRLIEVQGEIEVIEPVAERQNLHRAIVRKNLSPIDVGALIVPGRVRTVSTSRSAPSAGPEVRIVGAQFSDRRTIADIGGFVFVNGGSAAGLVEGAVLPIRSNVQARNKTSGAHLNDRQIGLARIVQVGGNFATAVLVEINDDVIVGDLLGGAGGATSSSGSSSGLDLDLELDETDPSAPAPTDATLDGALDFGDESPAPMDSAPSPDPAIDDELSL